MPKPTKRVKMICFFDAPSSYSQPVSVSISFQIIPLGVCQKSKKIRIGLLVGGYSIPAIPTQSTENEGRVGRAGMPYPPTFVAFNPYI